MINLKKSLITFIIITMFCLTACTTKETDNDTLGQENMKTENQNNNVKNYGNTSGNITNGGFVVEYKNYIYYSHPTNPEHVMLQSDLMKINADESKKTVLVSGNDKECLNIINDWIYYISDGSIYKVNIEGENNTLITTTETGINVGEGYITQNLNGIQYMQVVDDMIYCNIDNVISEDAKNGIYTINVLDGEVKQLSNVRTSSFTVIGDWIYYNNGSDKWCIYKMKVDGSENIKINDTPSYRINIVDNTIYYSDDFASICKMDLDGKNSIKLTTDEGNYHALNVSGEWIYYTITKDGVYKMKLDGSENAKLCDYTNDSFMYNAINVAGDWIYFTDVEKEGVVGSFGKRIMYRMKKDGSTLKALN